MRATRSAAELLVGAGSQPGLTRNKTGGPTRRELVAEHRMITMSRMEEMCRSGSRSKLLLDSHVSLSSMTKVEFGHATGEHGLEWEDCYVTKVTGQARRKGVMVGWKIYMVDGKPVKSAHEIFHQMQEAKYQWRGFTVYFNTDMPAIRREHKDVRNSEIQAEVERLARLPFEGVHDPTHMEQVNTEFVWTAAFDRAEDRAVTLAQLNRVVKWTDAHCHRWRDPVTKLKLQVETMTMGQLNHWLIKPATKEIPVKDIAVKEKGCSLMELLAVKPQPPDWFICCSMNEQLKGLFLNMKIHKETRKLKDDTAFWMGPFAYRQHWHGRDEELNYDDPKKSAFYRAMAMAKFQVLMPLDMKTFNGNLMTPFTRIWSNHCALQICGHPEAILDIAAVQDGKAQLITMGLTDEEKDMEMTAAGSGYKVKAEREKFFSKEVINFGLNINIQRGESSNPEHRVRILNGLAGRSRDLAPLEDHPGYIDANRKLQALIALTCWRKIMTAVAEAQSEMQKMQERLADTIRNDLWRESLDLSISFTPGNIEKLALLGRSLPPTLRDLKLDMRGMNLTDETFISLAASMPNSLEALRLDVSGNAEITNYGVTQFTEKNPQKLTKQSLGLKNTSVTKEFLDHSDTLEGIKKQIWEETQKGSLCHTYNFAPHLDKSRKGMSYTHELTKV
jgi:hypothetical protein